MERRNTQTTRIAANVVYSDSNSIAGSVTRLVPVGGSLHVVLLVFALVSTACASAEHHNIGVKECAACHSTPSPIYEELGVTKFVRLVEAKEWQNNDKHSYAYELVRHDLRTDELKKESRRSNRVSIVITSRLGWSDGDGNFEKKCLTCHVGYSDRQAPATKNFAYGVQCESCHGPGSEYAKTENHQQPSWRARSPKQKDELGMWDLTSASTTAAICLSCHLGNINQNRFITHDMYAAGHPVLPPFDLQSFLNAMPPHWKTLQEKPQFELQPEYNRAHFDIAGNTDEIQAAITGSYDKTRRSMMGGLVANDLGIEMIHQGAADARLWGDYSIYNCMGCHQDLKKNSVQYQTSSRVPGRPFPAEWLNLENSVVHFSRQDSHATIKSEMLASFNSVPFGDAKRLNQLSEGHLQTLKSRFHDRRTMERQAMSKLDVQQWLANLLSIRNDKLEDYWVAKQTASMVCIAVDELVEHGELASTSVAQLKKELSELLQLDIHLFRTQSVLFGQEDMLKNARTFDPVRCRELLTTLQRIATVASGAE